MVHGVLQVLVYRRNVSKVALRWQENSNGSIGVSLSLRRAGNYVGVGVRAGETRDHRRGNERGRESQVGDGIQEDEVIGDAVSAPDHPLSAARIPRKTNARRRVPGALERLATQVQAAQRSGPAPAQRCIAVAVQVREN